MSEIEIMPDGEIRAHDYRIGQAVFDTPTGQWDGTGVFFRDDSPKFCALEAMEKAEEMALEAESRAKEAEEQVSGALEILENADEGSESAIVAAIKVLQS